MRFEVRHITSGLNYYGVYDTIKHEWVDYGCKTAMEALCRMINR